MGTSEIIGLASFGMGALAVFLMLVPDLISDERTRRDLRVGAFTCLIVSVFALCFSLRGCETKKTSDGPVEVKEGEYSPGPKYDVPPTAPKKSEQPRKSNSQSKPPALDGPATTKEKEAEPEMKKVPEDVVHESSKEIMNRWGKYKKLYVEISNIRTFSSIQILDTGEYLKKNRIAIEQLDEIITLARTENDKDMETIAMKMKAFHQDEIKNTK